MTQQEMAKLRVIDQTIVQNITAKEAAEQLGLSECQIYRLKKGVVEHGAAFIVHKNKERKPAHAVPDDIKHQIVSLKRENKYKDANFTHYQELL